MSAPELGDVAATSLITLYAHAQETQSADPVLSDPKAVGIARTLSMKFAGSENPLVRTLVQGTLDPRLVVHIALRARRYDDYVREFLAGSPGGVVVNIGCGLDSRFLRIDNGEVIFYDLDLPEVIALKREFFEETDRYRLIAASVLEKDWIPRLQAHEGPLLFLAEGVFMYLEAEAVKGLFVTLAEEFPGSELVCEVVNAVWVREPLRAMMQFKLRRELHMGEDAVFRSGIRDGREPEEWHPGIRLLDEWSYFDAEEPKLGWLRLFRHSEFLRKTQWTVHYRLG
ncbi:MAG: class I SAM-dependent methyltransferase [Methanomicrobiaceae archaeon]|nr:class I SAM-dependent methyltransferase [Methanomicrobiaceae archaeon]